MNAIRSAFSQDVIFGDASGFRQALRDSRKTTDNGTLDDCNQALDDCDKALQDCDQVLTDCQGTFA